MNGHHDPERRTAEVLARHDLTYLTRTLRRSRWPPVEQNPLSRPPVKTPAPRPVVVQDVVRRELGEATDAARAHHPIPNLSPPCRSAERRSQVQVPTVSFTDGDLIASRLPAVLVMRQPTLDVDAAWLAATAAGLDSGLSLVLVRDGVAESFRIEAVGDAKQPSPEDLTVAEARILRYLPSNLTVGEIASELGVSTNTVKTHMRHIYAKLNAHRRREAVQRARALGVLGAGSVMSLIAAQSDGSVDPRDAAR